jgi:hypothetical protein
VFWWLIVLNLLSYWYEDAREFISLDFDAVYVCLNAMKWSTDVYKSSKLNATLASQLSWRYLKKFAVTEGVFRASKQLLLHT